MLLNAKGYTVTKDEGDEMILSGPLFERSDGEYWKSIHGKEGGHYNCFKSKQDPCTVEALKYIWDDPSKVNNLNFILFGTSGIHGSYGSVKELRESFDKYGIIDGDGSEDFEYPEGYSDTITFVIIQPRLVTMRYGNVRITSNDDLVYLEALRDNSAEAVKEFLK